MLRRTLTASLAIALFMPILLRADDAPKGDKDLEGDWVLVSHVYDGKESPPAAVKDTVLTFQGDGAITNTGGGLEKAAVKADPTRSPKEIDVTPKEGRDKGKTFAGVYEVKGDELRVCSSQPGKERPTELLSKAGSGWTLMILKRVKK
jgi:uncharacterized protein (TIGR03067 family)